LVFKVRANGWVVNAHALLAVGVHAEGHREILSLDFSSGEGKAGPHTQLLEGQAEGGGSHISKHHGDKTGDRIQGSAWRRSVGGSHLPETFSDRPRPCPNDVYEQRMTEAMDAARQAGADHLVFGDLFSVTSAATGNSP